MKAGGVAAKPIVRKTQAILQQVGIDPIYGKENLVWAPNWQTHRTGTQASTVAGATGKGYAQAVYDRLTGVEKTKAAIVTELQNIARDFIIGRW